MVGGAHCCERGPAVRLAELQQLLARRYIPRDYDPGRVGRNNLIRKTRKIIGAAPPPRKKKGRKKNQQKKSKYGRLAHPVEIRQEDH